MKKANNLVAKYANTFNRSVTMRDKKKDYNRKMKHPKNPEKSGFFHFMKKLLDKARKVF